MHPVKQKITALLAQAKGTRWDRVAARVCGWGAILIALAPYVHLLPGPEARILAGILGFIGQYLPRAQKAAGLLSLAYGQQTPFLKVLPQLAQTLLSAPQITAEAKAQAEAEAQKQAQDAFDQRVEQKVGELLKSGMFTVGTGPGNLSGAVPEALRASKTPGADENPDTDKKPDTENPGSGLTSTFGLTSTVTVGDKTL